MDVDKELDAEPADNHEGLRNLLAALGVGQTADALKDNSPETAGSAAGLDAGPALAAADTAAVPTGQVAGEAVAPLAAADAAMPPPVVSVPTNEPPIVANPPAPKRGGRANAAKADMAAQAVTQAAPDVVQAALEEQGDDMGGVQGLDLRNAISNVHDAATDAKRAEDARQAREEQEVRDAMAQTRAQQIAVQPTYLQNVASRLTTGKDAERPKIATPLEELQQRRELLGKIQGERQAREDRARGQALLDPNSDVTKTSAMALRAAGIPVPKGYTASMFNDMQSLGKLSGEEREKASRLILDQHKADEEKRQHNLENSRGWAEIHEREADRQAARLAPSKEALAKQQQTLDTATQAHAGLQEAGTKLRKLISKYGTSGGLTGPGRQELEQAVNEAAEHGLKLRQASNPGAALRPNAIEEERNLIFQPGFFQQAGSAQAAIKNYLNTKAAEAQRLGVSTGGLVRHNGKLYREDANGNAVEVQQ